MAGHSQRLETLPKFGADKILFFTGILFKHPSKYLIHHLVFSPGCHCTTPCTMCTIVCVLHRSVSEYQFAYYFIILMPPLDSLLSSHSPSTCIEALLLVNERYCKPLIGWHWLTQSSDWSSRPGNRWKLISFHYRCTVVCLKPPGPRLAVDVYFSLARVINETPEISQSKLGWKLHASRIKMKHLPQARYILHCVRALLFSLGWSILT